MSVTRDIKVYRGLYNTGEKINFSPITETVTGDILETWYSIEVSGGIPAKDMGVETTDGFVYPMFAIHGGRTYYYDRNTQESINKEDVKRPLVVGHKDIRASLLDMLLPPHCHWAQGQVTGQSRPNHTRIIGENTLTSQYASHNRKEGRKERQQQEKGDTNHPKVDSIEDSSHVQLDFDANITANFKPDIIFLPKYFHKRVIIALFAVAKEYKYINIYIHE